ncbi:toll/interleukin-1 receptor domain-containing protein [Escherichia coli]|nr:toll/interleukin-1 receptor domain-containing protein [Escherichia coli]
MAQNGGISSFLHRSILRAKTTLVFSYSHADEALRNELEKHLSPLKRTGKITTWHDRRIVPGQEFERQIAHYFSQADIILILISSDFIASDYCYQVEMKNVRILAWREQPFWRNVNADSGFT